MNAHDVHRRMSRPGTLYDNAISKNSVMILSMNGRQNKLF